MVRRALPTARAMIEARFQQKESKLARKKKVVRRAWSKEDVRTLKTMARSKAGVARIAKALKRTIGATAVKAHQLGVSLDTRG
jgi:ATP-dependent exoDNAse (exonuclease V) alpha subunit